jgi:hypothetical protein
LVDINGDPDLSALATKAELSSGLSEKVNLDTYLLGESLPGVPVTDGIEMAYFPKLSSFAKARATVEKSVAETITGI